MKVIKRTKFTRTVVVGRETVKVKLHRGTNGSTIGTTWSVETLPAQGYTRKHLEAIFLARESGMTWLDAAKCRPVDWVLVQDDARL